MDCEKLAAIYVRSCVDETTIFFFTRYEKILLDKNCMKVMQIMKRSCYQFDKKEEFEELLKKNKNN